MVNMVNLALAALPILSIASAHHHCYFRGFDEANCNGTTIRGEDKLHGGKCKTVKDFGSFTVMFGKKGSHATFDDKLCEVTAYEQDSCHGQSMTSGDIRHIMGVCRNAEFPADHKEPHKHFQGRSVKLTCHDPPKPQTEVLTTTLARPWGPTTVSFPRGPVESKQTLVVDPRPFTTTETHVYTPTGFSTTIMMVPGPEMVETTTKVLIPVTAKPATSTTTITVGAGKTTTTITIPPNHTSK